MKFPRMKHMLILPHCPQCTYPMHYPPCTDDAADCMENHGLNCVADAENHERNCTDVARPPCTDVARNVSTVRRHTPQYE